MNNPLFILQTLDRHLDHPVELTLYGRAALALGFPAHEPRHETTQDVDAIIPLAQLDQLRADEQFWNARDATNAELAERGLYLTHDGLLLNPLPAMPTALTANETFTYGVFLIHSAKDKAVVRPLAERLRAAGLRLWFGEW